jgi:putative Holliday junction resolvase
VGRILAIDYGTKRCGIAVTDPLRIIASGLETVPTSELLSFLERYFVEQEVDVIVIGEPLHKDGRPTSLHPQVVGLSRTLTRKYPSKEIVFQDESYSSQDAKKIILQSGAKKKKRREKGLIDKVSAGLILQEYLDQL